MVNAEAIRSAVGVLGNIISFGLFLAPLPTFVDILKKKSVEKYSPVPYLATFMNCLLWCLYGLPIVHPDSLLVITINGSGLVLQGTYILIFLIFANDAKQRSKIVGILLAELAFIAVVAGLVLSLTHTHEKRSMIVGILCIIFGVCMYASPLAVLKVVVSTKSVEYLPFMPSFTSFINGVCWTSYALIKFDLYMVIPNGLGTFLGVIQLLIYGIYFKSTKQELICSVQLDS
ncbi:bidirectional sugar transporter SWEET4-like [Asparagus officinalis]|uniref:bidirectional sugar transporter SWEET4-like n=1 Tax=Asparagus officinalis TaxID=4686 RepID=UPI00098E714E|nr:bidirectional sugar transporter SWEET4-like [Asparagus officinalis]